MQSMERHCVRTRRGANTMKRHECCKTCGYLITRGYVYGTDSYFCVINGRKIEYPRKMGGRDKCPCYMNKAEYKKANKKRERERKKRDIENFVYPEKSDGWF